MHSIYLFTSCVISWDKKQSASPISRRVLQYRTQALIINIKMPITPITVLSNIYKGSMFSTSHPSVIFLIYFSIYV